MPVLDDPVVVLPAKIGGNYYRVTAWAKDRPDLPTVPDASKTVWRKHNILGDVIETTEPIPGVAALDIEKESIPENGIGDWTIADFKGVQKDEEARKPFQLHSDSWNQACGQPYDLVRNFAIAEYKVKRDGGKDFQIAALARLRARMKSEPLGHAVKVDPIVLADWKELVTAAPLPLGDNLRLALADNEKIQTVIKTTTIAVKEADPEFTSLQKVPGWSPTNAYIGTVQSFISTGSAGYNWQSNAVKFARTFTTVGAYNAAAFALNVKIAGAPTGTITARLYAGDPSSPGAVLVDACEVSIAELSTAYSYLWFGGGGLGALGATTVYCLEWSTTATLDGTNYLVIQRGNAGGGSAGDQDWIYSGSWAAQTTRNNFAVSDNADGGKFLVRTDAAISTFATIKGAAVATTDTYTVTMGATLTRATNVTCLQGRQGDTIALIATTYGAGPATYRYGYEVVNAGVTVTWTGNAGASSGWNLNPTTADTSSKGCRLTFNGTAGSRIKITNLGDASSGTERWMFYIVYGAALGGYFDAYYNAGGWAATTAQLASSSANTTAGSNLTQFTWTGAWGANQTIFVLTASSDIRVTVSSATMIMATTGIALFSFSTLVSGFVFYCPNLRVTGNQLRLLMATTTADMYMDGASFTAADSRFSEATPATFAVADAGTGGELDITVGNPTAIAAGDFLVVFNSGGTEIGRISRAAYEAPLYGKAANSYRLGGFVDDTAYTGMYAKFTRDGILFGPASNTANATPTLSAAYAAYLALEATRNVTAGASNILTGAHEHIAGAKIDGTSDKVLSYDEEEVRNTLPDLALVPTPATGGPAAWKWLGTDPVGTLDLDAVKTAYENSRNDPDGIAGSDVAVGHAPKIKNVTYTGTASSGSPLVAISIILDAAVVAVNGTITVTGGVTVDQNITGATVTLTRKKKSDGSTVATPINTTANFVQGVQKTWAAILGADCTITPTIAREEYLEATVVNGTPAITSITGGRSDYVVKPAAPTWASTNAVVGGDGTLVLSVVAGAATDVIYARHRRFLSSGAWSAESETFKRTGTGTITITGQTNEQYREVVVYAKAGGVTSDWSEPRYDVPTDGATAVIDRLMDAVVAEIGTMGLASETTAGVAVNVTAEVEVPPDFETVDTPVVKVFPDTEEAAADHNDLNEIRYRVNVAFCQRSKTAGQVADQYRIREKIRDQFLGKRLVGMTDHYCERETESGVLDLDALWERFHWVSVLTLEFVALRAQG